MSTPATTGRRLLSALLCLALIASIFVAQRFIVAKEDLLDPIPTSGDLETGATTDDFAIEITGVDTASTLTYASGVLDDEGESLEANGVWVVVWARVTALRTTIHSMPAELRMKDGTVYTERRWFTDSLEGESFSPEIPLHGAFVFEVPEERLDDPTLVVTHAPGHDQRLSSQATVGLGLGSARPSDEPVALLPPEVRMEEAADASE